jgi:hypothetical protein
MTLRTPKRLAGASPAHARARTQEKGLAQRIGGRTTRGSGSGYEQGDVRLHKVVRVEAKTTRHASFSVTEELIDKLEAAVVGAGEIPILQVELRLGARKVIVMPDWALDWIVDRLKGEGA